jgi:hypothetical protein
MSEMPKIESQDITIQDLFKDFYVVPDFQREYIWQEKNVEALLRDVMAELYDEAYNVVKGREYFIGSVVTDCLSDNRTRALFRPDEITELLRRVEEDVIPWLDNVLDEWGDDCLSDDDPRSHFAPLMETLGTFRDTFQDRPDLRSDIQAAIDKAASDIDELAEEFEEKQAKDEYVPDFDDWEPPASVSSRPRDIFDDVDE